MCVYPAYRLDQFGAKNNKTRGMCCERIKHFVTQKYTFYIQSNGVTGADSAKGIHDYFCWRTILPFAVRVHDLYLN